MRPIRLISVIIAAVMIASMTGCNNFKEVHESTLVTENKTEDINNDEYNQESAMENSFKSFIQASPYVKYMSEYNPDSHPLSDRNDWSNIKAITYDGAEIDGNKTKVFAYIGFPNGASPANKVPAMVLVHGGGGHAFAEWVKLWNDKGYAAIAMETTGYFPSTSGKGIAGKESDAPSLWNYGLYADFLEDGYTNAPNNDELTSSQNDYEDQWMYHAVIDTIVAHNILKNDNRVISDKIGITGISWGGIITSIAIGYDTDYAFAIPVYGCGYLEESYGAAKRFFESPLTRQYWSAAARFSNIKFPVLWLSWANDVYFSVNANSMSYLATKRSGSVLSAKVLWGHSHGQGWASSEIYRFADSITKDKPGLVSCVTEPEGSDFSFRINIPMDASSITANIYYINANLSYSVKSNGSEPTIDQAWKMCKASVSNNIVIGHLPADAKGYFVEIVAKTGSGYFSTSTSYVELND